MLATFEGRMGQGKTLSATVFSVLDWFEADRRIVANYDISLDNFNYIFDDDGNIVEYKFRKEVKKGDFIQFDYEYFVDAMEKNEVLYNTTVVIDEAYLFADARMTQSGFNKLLSYFVMQTRKRDVDLYLTTQQFENIDVRLRRNTDLRVLCRFNKGQKVITCRLVDLRSGLRRRMKIYAPEYWNLYNTCEIPTLRPGHIRAVNL